MTLSEPPLDEATFSCFEREKVLISLLDVSLSSDGSDSKLFDPGRVRYGLGLNLENFPLKMSKFSIFFSSGQKKSPRVGSESTRVKGGSTSYLQRVKSKLGSGQGPSLGLSLTLHFSLMLVKMIALRNTTSEYGV